MPKLHAEIKKVYLDVVNVLIKRMVELETMFQYIGNRIELQYFCQQIVGYENVQLRRKY